MSYAGRHVVVLGVGRSGAAALALLARQGARLSAYDRDPARLRDLPPEVERLTGPTPPALDAFDVAIVSPGLHVAPGPHVVAEVELGWEHLDATLIGVTGTNGKSTTTLLIGRMLEASGLATAVGGNLGTPLCELTQREASCVVAELSSFQLEHVHRLRARVAVLLNLAPDHLDRHGSLQAYGAAKERLAQLQHPDDVLVPNLDDAWARRVASRSPGRTFGFSRRREVDTGACLDGAELVVRRDSTDWLRLHVDTLAPALRATPDNALAAACATHAAGGSPDAIESVLRSFEGLPHRVQTIWEERGVRWVDDSKATNPAAAAASAAAFAPDLVWILGGRNKGLDLAPLAVVARTARAAVLYGEAAAELERVLAPSCRTERVTDLRSAVRAAARLARVGDAVVLAPACASFDQFASFEERGDSFARWARELSTSAEGARC